MPSAEGDQILVGDIGATNCRMAVCTVEGGRVRIVRRATQRTGEFDQVGQAIAAFVGERAPARAALAIAGPVRGDDVALTNARWRFSAADLKREFGFSDLLILNDLVAQAEGVLQLATADFDSLGGRDVRNASSFAVVGLGTGLGVAHVRRGAGAEAQVAPTEGGHAGFAAYDALDLRLIEVMREEVGRVVLEHVLSGPGIMRLHRALARVEGRAPDALESHEIVRLGAAGDDADCARTVSRFALALASACADIALIQGAQGVVLAGEIANALRPALQRAEFRERFETHGPGRGFLSNVPVAVATAADLGLSGAGYALIRR